MAPWKPEPELERLVATTIAGRRDFMANRLRKEGQALDNQLAARGLIRSGNHLSGHSELEAVAYEECVQGAMDDVFALVRDVYGEIPVEASPWLRTLLTEWIDALANGLVAMDADRRRKLSIGGHGDPPAVHSRAQRRLDIELSKLELKARLRELTPPERSQPAGGVGADCFICHASEDKATAARPIADALRARGYAVWLDEAELTIGARLLDRIDDGLANCRFGIVILSPSFFGKKWTRRELAGLVAREDAEDRTIILPVWLDVDETVIAQHLPSLAGVLAAKMASGVDHVVGEIVRAMGRLRESGNS